MANKTKKSLPVLFIVYDKELEECIRECVARKKRKFPHLKVLEVDSHSPMGGGPGCDQAALQAIRLDQVEKS